MGKLEIAQQKIATELATARQPAVLCSFGKDSMLLLRLALDVRRDITVLWFRTGFDEAFPRRIIRDWNLTAISWAPTDVHLLVGPKGERALALEHSFSGFIMPVLIDMTAGDSCVFTKFAKRTERLNVPFDLIMVGWKDSDSHWIKGRTPLKADGFSVGPATVIAPLRDMSDDEVRAAVLELGVPYTDNDELPLCTACMGGVGEVYCPEAGGPIPRKDMDHQHTLALFKQRHNLEDDNGARIH